MGALGRAPQKLPVWWGRGYPEPSTARQTAIAGDPDPKMRCARPLPLTRRATLVAVAMASGLAIPSAALALDIDVDGLDDAWELTWFGEFSQTADDDFDGDTLTNGQEQTLGTNPTMKDSDGDGLGDQQELSPANGVARATRSSWTPMATASKTARRC